MEMRKCLDELNANYYNQVDFIREDRDYYYFERSYKNGEQDELRVSKLTGDLHWREKGTVKWMYDSKIVA